MLQGAKINNSLPPPSGRPPGYAPAGDDKPANENVSDSKKFKLEVCEELFASIGVEVTAAHRPSKRNPDGNYRPLKITLSSEDDFIRCRLSEAVIK